MEGQHNLSPLTHTQQIYLKYNYTRLPSLRNSKQIPRLLSEIFAPLTSPAKQNEKIDTLSKGGSKSRVNFESGYRKRELREIQRKKKFQNFLAGWTSIPRGSLNPQDEDIRRPLRKLSPGKCQVKIKLPR